MNTPRWLAVVYLAGCASEPPAAPITVDIETVGVAGQVASVEVLVLGGTGVDCHRALAVSSPLDDAGVDILAHALLVVGAADAAGDTRLANLPLDADVVFYGEGFADDAAAGARNSRGCAEARVTAGGEVTIVLSPP